MGGTAVSAVYKAQVFTADTAVPPIVFTADTAVPPIVFADFVEASSGGPSQLCTEWFRP